MAYEKTTWASGDTITAAKLNNIENGIGIGGIDAILYVEGSVPYAIGDQNTVYNKVSNGVPVIVIFMGIDTDSAGTSQTGIELLKTVMTANNDALYLVRSDNRSCLWNADGTVDWN